MAKADCFIVLDAEREKVAAGDLVQVQVFGGIV
jgi:molybdopterin biosynthesis enzyme